MFTGPKHSTSGIRETEKPGPECGRSGRTLKSLEAKWGSWRVPWGNVNRLQRNHTGGDEPFDDADPSLPVHGGPGWLGNIFTFEAGPGALQNDAMVSLAILTFAWLSSDRGLRLDRF